MYKLLIVDDEWFAVEGIEQGVDWKSLEVTEIYKSYNAEQAKEIIAGTPIDIVICDIEMPDGNGIELMEWVRGHNPSIQIIFLTCHADFKYAQRAIRMGSFEYLLKPVEFELLSQTAKNALDTIVEDRRTQQLSATYSQYMDLWESKKPVIYERFWQDLFWQRIIPTSSHIQNAIDSYKMPLSIGSKALLIMISIEQWAKKLNVQDEELMEYALRNAAEELIMGQSPGQVLQDRNGAHFVLFYADEAQKPNVTYEQLKQRCTSYIEACSAYFYCRVSCYIGDWTPLGNVWKSYNVLLQMEHNNVTHSQTVLFSKEQLRDMEALQLPALFEWSELMEQGKMSELDALADNMFAQLRKEAKITTETLRTLYHSLLQTVYYVLHKRGVTIQMLFTGGEELDQAAAVKSLDQLQQWTKRIIRMATEQLAVVERESTVVDKVKGYIIDHLYDEISREELANFAHVNSSYLSRLFKKEAGISLTDFIAQERMRTVRDLLIHSDEMISNIAKSFHYTNFSHFSKMFRRFYGMNPQDYRRQFHREHKRES